MKPPAWTGPDGEAGGAPPGRRRIEIVYDLPSDHPKGAALTDDDRREARDASGDPAASAQPTDAELLSPLATRPTALSLASPTAAVDAGTSFPEAAPLEGQALRGTRMPPTYDETTEPAPLADIVDRVYDKLRVNAVKVVALDDLSQQLLERFGLGGRGAGARPPAAAEVEKGELALQLYTLRTQVGNLKALLDERERVQRRELAKLVAAAESAEGRQRRQQRIKVEVVKAFEEEEPLPYRKPPYQRAHWRTPADAPPVVQRKPSKKSKARGGGAVEEEESPSSAYSSVLYTPDMESLTDTTATTTTASTLTSRRSKSISDSLSSVGRVEEGSEVRSSRPSSRSSSSSSSSPPPNAPKSGDEDSSDSSIGELFWKRRAAAAAAAAAARKQQPQPQPRKQANPSLSSSGRTTTTTASTSTSTPSSSSSRRSTSDSR